MSEANKRQVGGSHYKNGGEEHWDRQFRLFGPGYFIGCITKYVERYQSKNGIEDLEKARHFLEKLIELVKVKERTDGPERVPEASGADGVRPEEGPVKDDVQPDPAAR